MRVLVTRPEGSAQKTAARLTELGHTPIIIPLAKPVHDKEATLAALSKQHSAIAITSGEAVSALLSIGDAIDRHLLTTIFAVGRSTAQLAERAGFRTVLTPDAGDGNALAALIADHRREFGIPPEPLLYLAGRPRSKAFENQLDAAGVAYDVVECYRIEPVNPKRAALKPIMVDEPPDAVLLYSRESALRFFALPMVLEHAERLERTLFLCISRNVATAVPSNYKRSIVISATPDEDGLLDLL